MYNFDNNTGELKIEDRTFNIADNSFDEDCILLQVDLKEIQDLNFTVEDFPENLLIEVHSEDGFSTYLFHELEITKDEGFVKLIFKCLLPNKYWEGKYGLSTLLAKLSELINDTQDVRTECIDLEDTYKNLEIIFIANSDFNTSNILKDFAERLNGLIKQAERILSGVIWRPEYETNEGLYCTELLYPLLRKMGFVDVRYTHGRKEYGKDFTFSEPNKFGNLNHYGLQAKAGNIRGNVNSDIDEIIGQLSDAFSMSYFEVSANEGRQISTFIVAISGNFTDNAKDKIRVKTPPHFRGAVYFIDKDKTLELIEKYWQK